MRNLVFLDVHGKEKSVGQAVGVRFASEVVSAALLRAEMVWAHSVFVSTVAQQPTQVVDRKSGDLGHPDQQGGADWIDAAPNLAHALWTDPEKLRKCRIVFQLQMKDQRIEQAARVIVFERAIAV